MKKLLKYLKPYLKESILGPLFKLLEASFELFIPLVIKAMIDVGIANGDKMFILQRGIVLIVLAVIGFVCAVSAQYFAAKASVGFATTLREKLFRNIQGRSYSQIDSMGTTAMLTRITSDVNQVQTGVNLILRLFLRSPFIVFGAMIMAFTVNVKGALVFTIVIPVLFVVVFFVLLTCIPLYKKVQTALERVMLLARENLTGIRVIRAFTGEFKEIKTFDDSSEILRKFQLFAGRVASVMNPATFAIVNIATLVILYQGAGSVDSGAMERGALVALINYMAQILVELIKLANLIITVTRSLAGADRLADMLSVGNEQTRENSEGENAEGGELTPVDEIKKICFDHVSFSYEGSGKHAISDLSFSAKKGEIVGIIGGTGSGKTTLIHLLEGFYPVTEGEILINDRNINEIDPASVRMLTGLVPQTAVLFKGTIEENLRWGKKDATKDEMWKALELAQAKEFVEAKEGKLEAKVEAGGKNFSGGQRQRLSMARAFIRNADMLILDDSTSALDYATESKVRQGIRQISEDTICFIISQRAASIMDADLIIVLDDGAVSGIGKHDELMKSCEVYREIYHSQFPEKEVSNHA